MPHGVPKSSTYFWFEGRLMESQVIYLDVVDRPQQVVARCLSPREGESEWWSIAVLDHEPLDFASLQ